MHPAAWFTALLKDCHPLDFPTTTVWAACFAMFREPCLHFVGRFLQYTESRSAKSATVRSLANPLFPAFNSEQSCRQCNRTYSKTGQSRGHGSYQGTGQICPNPCGLCLSSSSLSRSSTASSPSSIHCSSNQSSIDVMLQDVLKGLSRSCCSSHCSWSWVLTDGQMSSCLSTVLPATQSF